MKQIQNQTLILIECELNDKFRRKEIVKKIKSEKVPQLEIEISCLKQYVKLEEHLNEILSANPYSISTLSILLNEIQLPEKIYQIVSSNISKFSNLKDLNIELSSVELTDAFIQPVLYEMVDLDSLKYLSLDFSNNGFITNNLAQFLGVTICQLGRLQKVSLNVSGCSQIGNEFIDKFCSLMKNALSLQDLSLHMSSTLINQFSFLENIKQVQNLKTLSISVNISSVDSESSFLENLKIVQSKIKSLSLNISGSSFSEDFHSEKYFFKDLGNILNESKDLREFYLNCENIKSKLDIFPFFRNLGDKIIEGIRLCINVDNEAQKEQLMSLSNEAHNQMLRIAVLNKLQNRFKKYHQLLD